MRDPRSQVLDEEGRQLLRRIVESLAWRQLASINMLGHCLKYVGELDTKLKVAAELDMSLRLFREVRDLYRDLGWQDLESAVRERVDGMPVPGSRLEFGLAYYVCGLTEEVAMESYLESTCPEFAAIARSHVEAATQRPEPSLFVAFASDPTNRPQAQQFLNTWLAVARRSFGRPHTSGDSRAVELGLRSHASAEMNAEFHERLASVVASCGLELPAAEAAAEGARGAS